MPSGAGLPHVRPIAVPGGEIDVTFAMTGAASRILGGNGSTVFSRVSRLLWPKGRGWFRGSVLGFLSRCTACTPMRAALLMACGATLVIVALIFPRGQIGTLFWRVGSSLGGPGGPFACPPPSMNPSCTP